MLISQQRSFIVEVMALKYWQTILDA